MTVPTPAQLLGGNAKAIKFTAPGDTIEGTIVKTDVKPVVDDKGIQETFKSGDPKWQIIATLQTNLPREDEDDDGQRSLYVKSYMFSAVKQAVAQSGAPELEQGGWLRVTYTHDGPKQNPMHSAPKMFTAEYRRPAPGAVQQQALAQPQQAAPLPTAQSLGYTPGPQQSTPAQPGFPQQQFGQPQAAPQQASQPAPDAATLAALQSAGLDPAAIAAIQAQLMAQQG